MTHYGRRQSGFTLVELLATTVIMSLVIAVTLAMSSQAGQVARRIEQGSTGAMRMRNAIDKLIQDAQKADRVLAQYPTNGVGDFATGDSTVVLRRPHIDSTAAEVPGEFDVVIYTLNGENLERYTATINGGAQSDTVLDRVLVNGVKDLQLSFAVTETYKADGSQKTYGLKGIVIPASGPRPNRIMVGGVDVTTSGYANYVGSLLKFTLPPKNGYAIDLNYSVDPSQSIGADGGLPANVFDVALQVQEDWRSASEEIRHRTCSMNSTVSLRSR